VTYPPAAGICIYCRKKIARDMTGGWYNIQLSDDAPWQCPMRWDQLDRRHVPEIPHD
jgi:hypothetical protein